MNSRNAFIFLIAILVLVSQLVGENSTLVSVAGADDAEIQQSLKRGEETLKNIATAPASTAPTRTVESALSLDDFYKSSGDDESSADFAPDEVDEAPDEVDEAPEPETAAPPPSAASVPSVPKGVIVDTVNGVPIMPQIR